MLSLNEKESAIEFIKLWVSALVTNTANKQFFHPNFKRENGFTQTGYLRYEIEQFKKLSSYSKINKNFSVEVYNTIQLNDTDTEFHYIVYNEENFAAFKWSITLRKSNQKWLIIGNDYAFQIVQKHSIYFEFYISHKKMYSSRPYLSLSINSPSQEQELTTVVSLNFERVIFEKSNTFDEDEFYIAEFSYKDPNIIPEYINLFVSYRENSKKNIHEKRNLPIPPEVKELPFTIDDDILTLSENNQVYHLSIIFKNGNIQNIPTPGAMSLTLDNTISKVCVTDSLDNDLVLQIV